MPVPSSIGTPDGSLAKTDKSKGFHYLTKGIGDAEIQDKSMTMYIEDGNSTFYNLKQQPNTFRGISKKIFDVSTSRKKQVIFSTDMYFSAFSKITRARKKRLWREENNQGGEHKMARKLDRVSNKRGEQEAANQRYRADLGRR